MNDTSNCETSALQALSDCMIDALSYDMECISDALLSDLRRLADKRPDYVGLRSLIDSHEPSLRTHLHHENADEFVESLETLLWRSIPERLRSNAAFSDRLDLLIDRAATAFSKVDHFQLTDDLHDIVNHCLTDGVDDRTLPVVITDSTIRIGRHTTVSFVRTLRIPEDGKTYQLPAGFGKLPIYRVEDYASTVPAKWLEDGGFFIPLYQREALYLEFGGVNWRPSILKVAVGHVNAITGKPFDKQIREHSQDYVVAPDQQWLDGINKGNGTVGQFVAMPLGEGYTVEEQVTDEAKHGGFQLMAYDSKDDRFPDESPYTRVKKESEYRKRHQKLPTLPSPPPLRSDAKASEASEEDHVPPTQESGTTLGSAAKRGALGGDFSSELRQAIEQAMWTPSLGESGTLASAAKRAPSGSAFPLGSAPKRSALLPKLREALEQAKSALSFGEATVVAEMGIAAGGSIEQKVIVDKHGADSWDQNSATPISIHMVNSEAFEAITGHKPPETPISAYSYKKRGIPWYSNYDESVPGLPGAKAFQFIKSILQIDRVRGNAKETSQPVIVVEPELIRRIHVPTLTERITSLRETIRNCYDQERYEAGIRDSTALLDLVPNDANALLMRAKCYVLLGLNDLADMDATSVLGSDPLNADAYIVRAYANLTSGWATQAADDAKAALAISPANQRAKELLQRALLAASS